MIIQGPGPSSLTFRNLWMMALDGAKKITERHADHPRSILAFLETHLETRREKLLEKLLETRHVLPFGCKDGHPNFMSMILALPDPLGGRPSGALQAYARGEMRRKTHPQIFLQKVLEAALCFCQS